MVQKHIRSYVLTVKSTYFYACLDNSVIFVAEMSEKRHTIETCILKIVLHQQLFSFAAAGHQILSLHQVS